MDNTCKNCKYYDMPITSEICLECLHFPAVCALWEPKLITNADRIRQMTDEELAEVISNLGDCDTCYLYHKGCSMNISCKDAVLEWLKKESE